jgi:hypothetical protein
VQVHFDLRLLAFDEDVPGSPDGPNCRARAPALTGVERLRADAADRLNDLVGAIMTAGTRLTQEVKAFGHDRMLLIGQFPLDEAYGHRCRRCRVSRLRAGVVKPDRDSIGTVAFPESLFSSSKNRLNADLNCEEYWIFLLGGPPHSSWLN